MEDTPQKPAPTPAASPPPRPIVDIQSPRPVVPPPPRPAVRPAATPLPAPESHTPPKPLQLDTPVVGAPPEPSKPASEVTSTSDDIAERPQPTHNEKQGAPMALIIAAILIALGLASAAIFAYLKTKDKGEPVTDHHTSAPSETKNAVASPQDVDTTTREVDGTLGAVDDAKDLPEADISDQALGL